MISILESEIIKLVSELVDVPTNDAKAKINEYAAALFCDYSDYAVEAKGHNGFEQLTIQEAISTFRWFPSKEEIIESFTSDLVGAVSLASKLDKKEIPNRLPVLIGSSVGWIHKGEFNLISFLSYRVIKCCNCDEHMRFSVKPLERKVVLADHITPCAISASDLFDVRSISIPSGKLALMTLDDFREYVPKATRKKFMSDGYSLSSILGVKSFNGALAESNFGSISMHHDCHSISVTQDGNEISFASMEAFDEDDCSIAPENPYIVTIGQGLFFIDQELLSELTGCVSVETEAGFVINLEPGKYEITDFIKIKDDSVGIVLGTIKPA